MPLTAEQLRAPRPLERRIVHVPTWAINGDDEVCLTVMSGRDMAELMAMQIHGSEADYMLALVARCLIDPETGERVFGDGAIAELARMPGTGLRDLFDEAVHLNRMGRADVEAIAKNCETTAGDGSGSGSPSIPGSDTLA